MRANVSTMASTARQQGEAGARRGQRVELAAALVLAAGGLIGLVVWAKWGLLVAFDAVMTYCFG